MTYAPEYYGGGGNAGGGPTFSQATILEDLQPIIQGDDRTVSFTFPAPNGFTTSAVATFGGHKAHCGEEEVGWLVTGSIAVSGTNWVLTFTLSNAVTDALDETAAYHWSVQVAEGGIERTLKQSNLKRPVRVIPKQT